MILEANYLFAGSSSSGVYRQGPFGSGSPTSSTVILFSGTAMDAVADLALRVFELSQTLKTRWKDADYSAKREILELLVESACLNSDNLEIRLKKPFDLIANQFPVSLNGAEESRTPDLIIANDALYQLSYRPGCGTLVYAAPGPRGSSPPIETAATHDEPYAQACEPTSSQPHAPSPRPAASAPRFTSRAARAPGLIHAAPQSRHVTRPSASGSNPSKGATHDPQCPAPTNARAAAPRR